MKCIQRMLLFKRCKSILKTFARFVVGQQSAIFWGILSLYTLIFAHGISLMNHLTMTENITDSVNFFFRWSWTFTRFHLPQFSWLSWRLDSMAISSCHNFLLLWIIIFNICNSMLNVLASIIHSSFAAIWSSWVCFMHTLCIHLQWASKVITWLIHMSGVIIMFTLMPSCFEQIFRWVTSLGSPMLGTWYWMI